MEALIKATQHNHEAIYVLLSVSVGICSNMNVSILITGKCKKYLVYQK